jgi:hypothetical protein
VFEKTNQFVKAEKAYQEAKHVVEENFGTDNKIFQELSNQINGAKLSHKSQTYTGRSEPV